MNVLITSASRKVGLVKAFQQALTEQGGGSVIAVDLSPLSPALYVADEHYLVTKSFTGDRTQTTIDLLEAESKVTELAKMLDGDSVSSQTLAYVRDLVKRNQQVVRQR